MSTLQKQTKLYDSEFGVLMVWVLPHKVSPARVVRRAYRKTVQHARLPRVDIQVFTAKSCRCERVTLDCLERNIPALTVFLRKVGDETRAAFERQGMGLECHEECYPGVAWPVWCFAEEVSKSVLDIPEIDGPRLVCVLPRNDHRLLAGALLEVLLLQKNEAYSATCTIGRLDTQATYVCRLQRSRSLRAVWSKQGI